MHICPEPTARQREREARQPKYQQHSSLGPACHPLQSPVARSAEDRAPAAPAPRVRVPLTRPPSGVSPPTHARASKGQTTTSELGVWQDGHAEPVALARRSSSMSMPWTAALLYRVPARSLAAVDDAGEAPCCFATVPAVAGGIRMLMGLWADEMDRTRRDRAAHLPPPPSHHVPRPPPRPRRLPRRGAHARLVAAPSAHGLLSWREGGSRHR